MEEAFNDLFFEQLSSHISEHHQKLEESGMLSESKLRESSKRKEEEKTEKLCSVIQQQYQNTAAQFSMLKNSLSEITELKNLITTRFGNQSRKKKNKKERRFTFCGPPSPQMQDSRAAGLPFPYSKSSEAQEYRELRKVKDLSSRLPYKERSHMFTEKCDENSESCSSDSVN